MLSLRIWRLAFAACALAVLVLSLAPLGPDAPSTGWDKTNHLLGFGTLGLLGCMAYPGHGRRVCAGLLFYGALIEGLQSLTSYRFAEWGDLLADALGIAVGWLLARLLHARRPGGM